MRGEKREARVPRRKRGGSGDGERLIPGFVRYDEESGTKVYSTYFYSPTEGDGRGKSAYSLASTDFEGGTPTTLYGPPSAGLSNSKYLDLKGRDTDDGQEEEEDEQVYGYRDMGGDHFVVPLPPGAGAPMIPEAKRAEAS